MAWQGSAPPAAVTVIYEMDARSAANAGINPLPVAPYSSSRSLLPTVTDVSLNQQVLYELAQGTGGFVIVNTNDLLGGLQKIAHEQNEYYVLGYTPPSSEEGSCHVLKVKIDRSGTVVRSRSGYCNIRSTVLASAALAVSRSGVFAARNLARLQPPPARRRRG